MIKKKTTKSATTKSRMTQVRGETLKVPEKCINTFDFSLSGFLSSLWLRVKKNELKQEVIMEGFVFRKSFNVINE